MNKTVLLIAGTFPPQEDVGGLRPAMFSKYLPCFGWRPIILTRTYPPDDINHKPTLTGIVGLPPAEDIVSVEMATASEGAGHNRFLNKIVKFFKPEYGQSWVLIEAMINTFFASRHSRSLDAIYATSPSFAEITVGFLLSRKLNVPMVVDFRDIVEQDEHRGFRRRLLYVRHIARRYWVTRQARHAIAVSDEQQKILARRLSIPVSVIVNGYDPEMFRVLADVQSATFTINYVGRILGQWLRDPAVFFEALDLLMEDRDVDRSDIEVNFIGCEAAVLNPILARYRCKELIRIRDRIDYERVPDLIGRSCINLVLTNRGRTGILTTKFFEYLAVRRPILCVPSDLGALDAIIAKTRSGLASADAAEVACYIKQFYLQWKASGGMLPLIDSIDVENYSRKHTAQELARLLDTSIKGAAVHGKIRVRSQ